MVVFRSFVGWLQTSRGYQQKKTTDRSEPGFYTYILESASSPGILYDNSIPLWHFPIEWGRVGLMFFYWVLSSQNVGFSIYAQIWYTTRWKRGSGEGITKNQLFHLHLETPGHIIRCLDNMFELVFPSCQHYADGIWVHPFPILGQRRFTAWFWWDLQCTSVFLGNHPQLHIRWWSLLVVV